MDSYWYGSIGSGISDLPTQALPKSKKNTAWQEDTMDALERIGLKQCRDNAHLRDYYRMVEGNLSHQELSAVIPQLREVEDMLDKADIPAYIKHYDILGIVINGLVGEYMQQGDSFAVEDIGEVATNEYLRDKAEMVTSYVRENLELELKRRLIAEGINPDPDSVDIEDPEQREQYLAQLQAARQAKTPVEIERHMRMDWRTMGAKWGQNTYTKDRQRMRMDEQERKTLMDYLLTGKCFTNFRVGLDYYRSERWSPLNTFYSEDAETEFPQKGEYVGRIHFYTPSQFVDLYAHKLSKKQKDEILQGSDHHVGHRKGTLSDRQLMKGGMWEQHIVPHHNYYDHEFLVGLQDTFDTPMGVETLRDKQGNETTSPRYLESLHQTHHRRFGIAESLRGDANLRGDLICVTEAYWKSYEKVGYLSYQAESGRMVEEIVSEDLLKEFLKEKGIKSVSTVSLEELRKNPMPNTIVWDYVPRVWEGVKANYGVGSAGKSLYLGVQQMEHQMRGDSHTYDTLLPVAGIVHQSLAKKLEPEQAAYNVVRNQLFNLLEKEIGLFFLFDINFLPSEFREWGDTEETLTHLKTLARDVGMFPVDASKGNIGSAGGFNQFSAQNMSLSSQMADRMQMAEYFKARLFEQVGFNPSRLGNPVKYETATGVVQSQNASYAQTEIYFERYSSYKQRMLEMHLAVAQYAKREEKDITVHFTTSDNEQSFLKFTDPDFSLRYFAIVPTSNAHKRKNMEAFKSHILNTNTLGSDELDLATLFSSSSMSEMVNMARGARTRKEKALQESREHEMASLEQQSQALEKLEAEKWARLEESKERDRQTKIEVSRVNALGRASDSNAAPGLLDVINQEADNALKLSQHKSEVSLKEREIARKEKSDSSEHEYKMEVLKLKIAEMNERLRRQNTDKYIATVNKN